ncbi:MAG: hypothetical protein ABFD07_06540 [Methanobacterium sp.]
MLVQKICKYCKGIIENAKPNQFYHKKEDNCDCYNNRMQEHSLKTTRTYRKRWKGDPNINKYIGTGKLSHNPHKVEETGEIDYKSEHWEIQKEKKLLGMT